MSAVPASSSVLSEAPALMKPSATPAADVMPSLMSKIDFRARSRRASRLTLVMLPRKSTRSIEPSVPICPADGRGGTLGRRPQQAQRRAQQESACGSRYKENLRQALAAAAGAGCCCPQMVRAWCYLQDMAYPLTAAQAHLGELVAETRQSHRPVTISEHGQPVAALISIDD